MKKSFLESFLATAACVAFAVCGATAQVNLIGKGTLTGSRAGSYKDLSGLNYNLENGVPANLLGGLGSGFTYVSGRTFLAVPDRGPNAVSYNAAVDDTVSYIARFHTLEISLHPTPNGALPFSVEPELRATTLLSDFFPLVYGDGKDVNLPSGRPPINGLFRHYFTGRSDNFEADQNSGFPRDARLDPEAIRVSNDGFTVFISDEYGPYVNQFLRYTGERVRTFRLPENLYVAKPGSVGNTETANNTSGRVANKGMEGLAITPDGKTLVGMMQAALIQDAALGKKEKKLLRIVTIDINSGATHEYGYALTNGSGVSEITAINSHEFLVDERDGEGLGSGDDAVVKQLFKIDLAGATEITNMNATDALKVAVSKTLFLDVVKALNAAGIPSNQIPSKLEGLTFGPDVQLKGNTLHTLWIANDNDFLQDESGPNQFFVFGVSDADLGGSKYVPQRVLGFDRF